MTTLSFLLAALLTCSEVFADGPAVTLGPPVLDASTVTFPVTLTNAPGTPISGISADIVFPSDAFDVVLDPGAKPASAVAGAAATASGKKVFQSTPSAGLLRLVIFDLAGNSSIADGVVAQVSLSLKKAIPAGSEVFSTFPTATDPEGNKVSIIGSSASLAVVSPKVTPQAAANGSISPDTVQSVSYNGSTSFTVTPAPGYEIASVTGCGGNLSGATYTTGPVTAACTVSASFRAAALPASLGDLNGDGKVDVSDALLALRLCVADAPPTAAELAVGDVAPLVNGRPIPDGGIDIRDAFVILQKAVGLVSW